MNNKLFAALAVGFLLWTNNGVARALTLTDVGVVDTLTAWAHLSNSGDSAELAWLNESIFGTQTALYYTSMTKINTVDLIAQGVVEPWQPVDDGVSTTNIYAYDFQSITPAYFYIKVAPNGEGKPPSDFIDHYLYRNIGSLNWGVVDLNLPGDLVDISVIGKISHTGEVGGTAPVPEPATMLLLGIGLAGLTAIRRRKKA